MLSDTQTQGVVRSFEHRGKEPAMGQVLIIPFEINLDEIKKRSDPTLSHEDTLMIIKTHFEYGEPFWKFAGGMLKDGQDFPTAAYEELKEETGAILDKNQLVEIYQTEIKQKSHFGTFPLIIYLAFGCDFSATKDPLYGEYGDEGEVVTKTKFGLINDCNTWPIPTMPALSAKFFPLYLSMLKKIK